ncbi:hypothetical protein JR316_0013333 [Psilocybe cubensis]|uniref:Uncharacterized protein n=2 Tax=Psilocybe cubensis TaxID=181762 RepID=A0ACB8GGM4_PSICU|nr:hypothetical protein JR316_0013333 [Psilocybe cubensis]KAH9474865.1 hypothetical protein JR316_0013333 [Psilocybe cubensis]
MVKKRPGTSRKVPAALHHELSEYASLLRALRVRDMMDLTKHILKPNPFLTDAETNPSGASHAGPSDLNHPFNAQTQPKSAKAKGKQKAESSPDKPKQIRRDHWTRWPLLLEDVPPPEWNLSDEVAVIASQVLKARPPLAFPCPISSSDVDDLMAEEDEDDRVVKVREMDVDSDDPDPPFYIPYLTSIMAKFLSTIFRILASHTPRRPASMQNRIEPLGWRSVIDVVVSCGIPEFANPKVVENVIKRIERLVGPSILPIEGRKATSFRAVERMKGKDAQSEAFDQLFAREAAMYWAPLELLPESERNSGPDPLPVKKRKSKREKQEEAGYRARKHWTPKDKEQGQSKSKPKPKPKPKSTAKTSKKKATPTPSVDVESPSASDSDTEVLKTPEQPQPVRRSTRAKNNVSYREIPPDDIPLI